MRLRGALGLAWLAACVRTLAAPPAAPPGPVVVVGIDSATWRVMDPLIAAGELPTFARLRDEGVSGELSTIVPTFSPTIWTSMMTGVVPGIHGIQTPAPPGEMPQTSDCRRVAALWDMASASCRRSNVLNLWCTWPAEPILGNVVSERTAWALPSTVSPDEMGPFVRTFLPEPARSRLRSLRHTPEERETGLAELALALQAVDPASFVMLYFRELDIVQHRAWATWPPGGTTPRGSPVAGEIPAAYRRYDAYLARIVASLPPGATLLVVSDHGMEAVDDDTTLLLLDPNVLLRQMGLQALDATGSPDEARSAAIAIRAAPGKPIALRVTGRVPLGELQTRLLEVRIDGQPFFRVMRASVAQLVLEAPLAATSPRGARIVAGSGSLLLGDLLVARAPVTGEHDGAPAGILLLHGQAARGAGLRIEGASILDIGPTVLAILGLPLPVGCQGRVLEEALRPQIAADARTRPPRAYTRPPPVPSRLPSQVQRADEEQLRGLGYVD